MASSIQAASAEFGLGSGAHRIVRPHEVAGHSGSAPRSGGFSRLVVRLPNWVGDACMAVPALELLASVGYDVVACGRGWAVDLFAGMPWRTLALPKTIVGQVEQFAALGAPRTLLLTNSFGSALAARMAGSEAIGLARDARGWLLGSRVPYTAGLHEVETFWRLAWVTAAADGGWPVPSRRRWRRPPKRLGLRVAAQHRQQAAQALSAAGPSASSIRGPYVVLAPLAVGTVAGRTKMWPGFAALAATLHELGVTMVACPGPGEEAATAAAIPGAHILPGLGLGAFAHLCARAAVVVANDSGPMHLAAAVDAPVIGIFGVSDPGRTAPWGLRTRVLGSAAGWPDSQDVVHAVRGYVDVR